MREGSTARGAGPRRTPTLAWPFPKSAREAVNKPGKGLLSVVVQLGLTEGGSGGHSLWNSRYGASVAHGSKTGPSPSVALGLGVGSGRARPQRNIWVHTSGAVTWQTRHPSSWTSCNVK